MALELGAVDEATETEAITVDPEGRSLRPRVAALAGASVLLVGMVLGFALPHRSSAPAVENPDPPTVTMLDLSMVEDTTPTISPDGRTLVFAQPWERSSVLARRSLDSLAVRPISGTENAAFGMFSPDGRNLVFCDAGGRLKTVPIEGGVTTTLAQNAFAPGPWGENGYIYYTRIPDLGRVVDGQTWRVPAIGGEPELVADGIATDLLHGEETLLVTLRSRRAAGFWADVGAVDLATGETRVLTQGAYASYVEPGILVFYRLGAVWAAPTDSVTGELSATARELKTEVGRMITVPVDVGRNEINRSGDLVYVRGPVSNQSRLVWVNRDGGGLEPVAPEIKAFAVPAPSVDGGRISISVRNSAGDGNEQWTLDLATGSWSRPAQSGSTSVAQEVPPDGAEILVRFEPRWPHTGVRPARRSERNGRETPSVRPGSILARRLCRWALGASPRLR